MTKSFKKANPLDKLNQVSAQPQVTTTPEMVAEHEEPIIQPKSNIVIESQPTKKLNKEDKKYLRLDITEYHKYISIMAEHNKVSMTKYINNLIAADMIKNEEIYNKLKQLEEEINRLKRGL